MGFYIRKSIKFGPFRLNFSKSGMGISAGIKGARISKGPRGTFVHLGSNGVYYRQSLSKGKNAANKGLQTPSVTASETPNVQLDEIKTNDVLGLVDSSFEESFKTIQENYARWFFGEKKIYLFYEIDEGQEAKAEKFYSIVKSLRFSMRYWHLNAQSSTSTTDLRKMFGGADVLNKSKPLNSLFIRMGKPHRFVTNVKSLVVPLIGKTLFFFPDRLFITEGRKIGTVNYNELIVEYGKAPTIMAKKDIPFGTKVLGSAWRYANKDGSPDKRYSSSNYQLPIADLSQLNLKSESGLNESIQFSRGDLAEIFAKALSEYAER